MAAEQRLQAKTLDDLEVKPSSLWICLAYKSMEIAVDSNGRTRKWMRGPLRTCNLSKEQTRKEMKVLMNLIAELVEMV